MTTPAPVSVPDRIRQFFHEEEVPYGLAAIRITLPVVLFGVMGFRWFFARELYSTGGVVTQLSVNYGYGKLMPVFPPTIAVALLTVLLCALICSAVGWRTRTSLAISWVLYTYFNWLDVTSTLTKYSVISSHILLFLTISRCGDVWSVDAWRQRLARRADGEDGTLLDWPKSSVWPRRMIQFLVGMVYFGAAMTKLRTPEYLNGDQLRYWMNTRVNNPHPLGDFLVLYPSLLSVFAYITLIWEVLFIFIAWRGLSRPVMLAIGAVFHIMTTITLGLYIFPMICISSYCSFLAEGDVHKLSAWWRRQATRKEWMAKLRLPVEWFVPKNEEAAPATPRVPNGLVFACTLLIVGGLGVGVESALDPFDLRATGGGHTLPVVSKADLAEYFSNREKPVESDKFFTFNLGTMFMSGHLIDRRDSFTQGEVAIAECTLNPPHEDLFVEVHLRDQYDQTVSRSSSFVGREDMRMSFSFPIDDGFEPGPYKMVLRSANQEIMRKSFTIEPGAATANAN